VKPFFLVAVIDKVRSPYLRGLPDFANSMNPTGDAELFTHVFNMSRQDRLRGRSGDPFLNTAKLKEETVKYLL